MDEIRFEQGSTFFMYEGSSSLDLSHSKVNCKNGAGTQLNDPVGRRTKHRGIEGTTATHCHNHYVGLRFQGELDNLLVRASSPHNGPGPDPARFELFRWNQVIQLLHRRRCCLVDAGSTGD